MTEGLLRGVRILTVDDSRAVRAFLSMLLEEVGAEVDEAATGEEALARHAADGPYDLILIDLVLPDIDGLTVLRRLRENDLAAAVVVLTGTGAIQSATQAVGLGADGYIEKQHLSGEGENDAFFRALAQAVEHRAGIVAQQELQKLKADFYSMVTHDLRNPTGSILASLKLLLSGMPGPITPRQEQLLKIATGAGEKMLALINDFLDFATIDAGYLRLERSRGDLGAVVARSAEALRLQAEAKRQTLTVRVPEEPVEADIDAARLEQVLDNLLSNAIKFTHEGGSIDVSLGAAEGVARLIVSDDGVGIPPERLPELFARFQRGAASRHVAGTGLGLMIAREIVEAHGGHVRAESVGTPGSGTRFIVDLPLP